MVRGRVLALKFDLRLYTNRIRTGVFDYEVYSIEHVYELSRFFCIKGVKILKRISRDETFMEIAEILAKRSTCQRLQVGALVVLTGRIVSCGYNGPVSGAPECSTPEGGGCLGPGCNRSIHAELNSILFAARAGISVEGATLYCTLSPCLKCAQAIINSGIKRVVFRDWYRDHSGAEFLQVNMVRVEQLQRPVENRLHWIDNGDSYFCPVCHHKVNNLNGVCPYCFSHVE